MKLILSFLLGAIAFVAGLFLIGAPAATATTFCVPDFSTACPNNGTNVKQPFFQTALNANGADGVPDTIYLAAGTTSASGTFTLPVADTDGLQVIGAGSGQTTVTSTAISSTQVINFANSARNVTVRDLTVAIPATMPDNGGQGIQVENDSITNVDVVSLNPGASRGVIFNGGGSFTGGHISGSGIGTIQAGFTVSNQYGSGQAVVEGATVTSPDYGAQASTKDVPLTIKRSLVTDPVKAGVRADNGSQVRVENSVIESKSVPALEIFSNSATGSGITAVNDTLVGVGATKPALNVTLLPVNGEGDATMNVTGTVIRGFPGAWNLNALTSTNAGDAKLAIDYSNFDPAGSTVAGDSSLTAGSHNINADPQFNNAPALDYSLKAGSPSIDAADPAGSGLSNDFAGNARPLDGNGDGTAINDQGAFESKAQAPTCQTDPAVCGDTAAPTISRVTFKPTKKKKPGKLTMNVSEASTVTATFKPTPAGKGNKKRRTLKLKKVARAAGSLSISIRKGKLKPGRYVVSLSAVDAAGNVSKKVSRKLKIK